MIKLPPNLLSRFVAFLLAFQLPTGVWVCHAGEGGHGADAHAAVNLVADAPPHPSEQGTGERHHQEHKHTESGNHDCPETFLAPTNLGSLQCTGQERALVPRSNSSPSPVYDVPQPIPIA